MILQTELLTSDSKPLASIKGYRDGLLFFLDESAPVDEVRHFVDALLSGSATNLFRSGDVRVSIDYGTRNLEPGDAKILLQPFIDRDNFLVTEFAARTSARQSLLANRIPGVNQSIHKGTVRAGQQLFFEGDVVIVGDVNPGGEVHASKDIYVFGRLRGTVHAGMHGDESAIVAAADFSPMQIRIADVVSRAPEVDGRPLSTVMEFAYLTGQGMAIDKVQYLPFHRQS